MQVPEGDNHITLYSLCVVVLYGLWHMFRVWWLARRRRAIRRDRFIREQLAKGDITPEELAALEETLPEE